MRLLEIASAEEQIALWKLVNDNVWAAINQQSREEAERKATAQRTAKLKGGKGKVKGVATSVRIPPSPPPKKAVPPPPQQQKTAVGAQQLPATKAHPQQLAPQPTQPIGTQKPIPPTQKIVPTALAQPQAIQTKPLRKPINVGFSARNSASLKNDKWG